MIKTVIIDDERIWLETLSDQLKKYCPSVTVSATCSSAAEGIEAIHHHRPDVVFTDVEMPQMSGFDMLDQFTDINFDVIFITAFEQYAVKAFKCSALDYLLKPIDPDELIPAIGKVEQKKLRRASSDQVELFFSILKSKMSRVKKIALPSAEGVVFVAPEKIIRCESESNYTLFILEGNQKILVAKTLKEADDVLQDFGFVRIHHSHLINPEYIDKYFRGDGGYILMKDGSHLTVSRTYKDQFNELFSKI